jgi:zinc finger protein ubi-d4
MTDIKIVNFSNLEKIAKFMADSTYRDLLEQAENFNQKTNKDRNLRKNFFDPRPFMSNRQRMPGLKDGQIYTYPSARWRKSRRQYLKTQPFPSRPIREPEYETSVLDHDQSSMGASGDGADSKDSYRNDDVPKEWFYDELDGLPMDSEFDEHDNSDNDYEISSHYRRERRKRGQSSRQNRNSRGRNKIEIQSVITLKCSPGANNLGEHTPTALIRSSLGHR